VYVRAFVCVASLHPCDLEQQLTRRSWSDDQRFCSALGGEARLRCAHVGLPSEGRHLNLRRCVTSRSAVYTANVAVILYLSDLSRVYYNGLVDPPLLTSGVFTVDCSLLQTCTSTATPRRVHHAWSIEMSRIVNINSSSTATGPEACSPLPPCWAPAQVIMIVLSFIQHGGALKRTRNYLSFILKAGCIRFILC